MTRGVFAAALVLVALRGMADPIVSWPSLAARPAGRGGLFTAWSVDQRKLVAAFQALERADPDRDVAALRRRAADDPTDLAAADDLAVRCWQKGFIHEAVPLLRRVLDVDPTFTRSRLNLAELFSALGSRDRAVQELAEGARLNPQSAILWRSLAELQAARGDARQAAAALQELSRLRPDDADTLFELGRARAMAGESEAAKEVAGRLAGLAGENARVLLALGDLYRALGDLRAARVTWEGLLEGAQRGAAEIQLGLLRLHQGEFTEVRERLAKAEASHGASVLTIAGQAAAALSLDDREAVKVLCSRLRSAGQARLAATLLANLWLAEGDTRAIEAVWEAFPRKGDGALDAYKQLLDLMRDALDRRQQVAALLSRAEVLKEAGWLHQAIEALTAAREQVRGSLGICEALALCHRAAGRHDGELAIREEMTKESPDSAQANQRLVWALIEHGDWVRAEEVCRAFLKRFYEDLESRVAGATIALRNGDYATAAADCRVVVGRHPADERPYALLLDGAIRSANFADGVPAIHSREGALRTFVHGSLERAVIAAAGGQWDDALAHAQRGLRRTARDHRLWLVAAAALEQKGDLPGAVERYQVASWLQAGHVSLHVSLARAAARAGLTTVAAEAYRTALSQGGVPFDVRAESADALAQWGRYDEAIAVLDALRPATDAQRRAVAIRLAEAHLAKGNVGRASDVARDILAKDPAEPNARRVALMVCRAKGDLAGALKLCEAATGARQAAEADAELGLLYLMDEQPRYKDAEEKLASAAAKAAPGVARAQLRRLLAVALLGQNLPKRALAALQDSLTDLTKDGAPSEDAPLLLAAAGDERTADDLVARMAKGNPVRGGWLRGAVAALAKDRSLAPLVLVARAAARAGWHTRAGKLFAQAAKSAPEAVLWLQEAAEAYASAGQPEPALALARQLVAACPNTGEAHFVLASVLDKQGKAEAALEAYGHALRMMSKEAVSLRRAAADRLRAGGRLDAAIEAYRSVLDATPDDRAVARALAQLYAARRPDQLAEAERLATLAAKDNPNDPASRDTLGWVHFLAKRPDLARAEIIAAISLEPRNAVYYYHLGMVDFVRGRRKAARRALRIALALDPKLPEGDTARSTLKAIEAEVPPGPGGRPGP